MNFHWLGRQNTVVRSFLAQTLVLTVCTGFVSVSLTQPAMAAARQIQLRGYMSQTVRQANTLFHEGKWEKAEALYTRAVKQRPNDPQARAGLAIVQANLFKLSAAEKNARLALQKSSKNGAAYMALGLVQENRTVSSDMTYRSQRDALLSQAVENFKNALKYEPHSPEIHNALGEAYRLQGKLSNAEQEFEQATSLDPHYSEAIANQGTVYKLRGDSAKAMALYNKAIRMNTKNWKAHYYLGEALSDAGQYHDALESFNTALYQNRNSPVIHTKMGETLEKQGNESAAITHYREAIRLQPEYFPAYQHLANIFSNRGDEEFAISEYKTGLSLDRNNDNFKMAIAKLSMAAGKNDQALQYYQEVLQKNPNNPDALEGYAHALSVSAAQSASQGQLFGGDQYVEAEEALKRAIQANPNDISLHLALLRMQRLSGDPALGRDELEKITQMTPHSETERIAQAEAYFSLGQYQASDNQVRQMIQSYQGSPKKLSILSDALMSNGDLDMAQECYKAVLQQDPNNLKAERGLNRIANLKTDAKKDLTLAQSLDNWYSPKQRKSARDFYQQTISKYPRQPVARLAMAKIYKKEQDYADAILEYQAYLELSPNLDPKERESIENEIRKLQEKLSVH